MHHCIRAPQTHIHSRYAPLSVRCTVKLRTAVLASRCAGERWDCVASTWPPLRMRAQLNDTALDVSLNTVAYGSPGAGVAAGVSLELVDVADIKERMQMRTPSFRAQ